MGESIQPVRGMHDYIGDEFAHMQHIIAIANQWARLYGYRPMQTPILEKADLFIRSAGGSSDVVMKEMYRFTDQGGEDLALRPEGTASSVRAISSAGLSQNLPHKFFYSGAMFRRERPQKGRLRQFHQFGIEYIGTKSPFADAEVIICGARILQNLGVIARLEINSLGAAESRKLWCEALQAYFTKHCGQLSSDSRQRIARNPLRILDSKNATDQAISQQAPQFFEFILPEESDYFAEVQGYLNDADLEFTINSNLVRGLDYYNDTAFEFISDAIGAQGTVMAGGRYDGLSAMVGGVRDLPAVGFASGIERLMLLNQYQGQAEIMLGIVPANADYLAQVQKYAEILRNVGIAVSVIPHGSVKQKMRRCNHLALPYVVIYGDDEANTAEFRLKNMQTGTEEMLTIDELQKKFLC